MSLQTVVDLLKKHRLVESMVQNQPLPRRKLVAALVQKQHLVELNLVLRRLTAVEIGEILSAITAEEAQLVWGQIEVNCRKIRADNVTLYGQIDLTQ